MMPRRDRPAGHHRVVQSNGDLRAFAASSVLPLLATRPSGVRRRRAAPTMFVDVVGFSTLSEQLGGTGTSGTERLTRELNGFFEPAITEIAGAGGEVLAFGGDSMFVAFADGDDPLVAARTADAIHALADRRPEIETPGGPVRLRVRVGASCGEVVTAVARVGERSVPLHGGEGLHRAVDAHVGVAPGATNVDPPLSPVPALPPTAGRGAGAAPDAELAAPAPPPGVAGLVHPVIANRLAHNADFVAEHRRVTSAFLRIDDADWSTGDGVRRLVETVEATMEVVAELGGEVVQFTSGDKGSVALALFGAPVAIPDPAAAAIGAAHRTRVATGASITCGIATGPSFMLLLGSPTRRAYTVLGDTPNLAARLLTISERGTTTCDGDTRSFAGARCAVESRRTVVVKGRDTPVDAHVVAPSATPATWTTDRVGADTPIVGRHAERARIAALLAELAGGRGDSVVVRGEPGIGKSRLLRHAVEIAPEGTQVAVVTGARLTTAVPYSSWGAALLALLGPAERALDAAADLVPRATALRPLLADALGVPTTDNVATAGLSPGERSELTERLLVDLVLAAARRRPLLLLLEDSHWLDEASVALAAAVLGEIDDTPVAVLASTRPEHEQLPVDAFASSIDLASLDVADTALLAADAWCRVGDRPPPPDVLAALAQRSDGNPLFVETLVAATREHGELPDDVPGGVSTLIAARLDRLDEREGRCIRHAAILDAPFAAADVVDCFGTAPADVAAAVDGLLGAGLLRTEVTDGTARHSFLHATVRDVAYSTISHAERQSLHGTAARHFRDRRDDVLLAGLHAMNSADPQLERSILPPAGRTARQRWRLDLAETFLVRAMDLLEGEEAAAAGVELAEIALVTGKFERVGSLVDSASSDPAVRIRQLLVRAEHAFNSGSFGEAEAAAHEALRLAEASSGAGASAGAQRARELIVRSLSERGALDAAVDLARSMLAPARDRGVTADLIAALASLGVALTMRQDLDDAAAAYEEARELAGSIGDLVRYVHVTSDLHFLALVRGDVDRARELLLDARGWATELGYRRHLAISVGNEANLALTVGDRATALRVAIDAVDGLIELGDAPSAMNSVDTMLRAVDDVGHAGALAELAARAARIEEVIDRPTARAEMLVLAAAWALLADDPERPARWLAAAAEVASDAEDEAVAEDVASLTSGGRDAALAFLSIDRDDGAADEPPIEAIGRCVAAVERLVTGT